MIKRIRKFISVLVSSIWLSSNPIGKQFHKQERCALLRKYREELLHNLFTGISVFAVLSLCSACMVDTSGQAGKQLVRVGIYENAPKVFTNDNGEEEGFFVDLLRMIAREENWELEYTRCEW